MVLFLSVRCLTARVVTALVGGEARREVLLSYVKGPFRGVVKNYVAGGVLVSDWDITINALFIPLKPWISSHFHKGAERALERLISP